MIIYLETFLIINSVVHYLITEILKQFLKIKISRKNFILSLIILNLYLFIYLNFSYLIKNYIILFGIVISIILGINKTNNQKLKIILTYYLFNFLLGGIVSYLYNISISLFYGLIIAFIILFFIEELLFYDKNLDLEILHYNLKIIDNKNQELYLNSYLDTGNFLIEDDNLPVIIINKKYQNKLNLTKIKSFNISTISDKNTITIYEAKKFYVYISGNYIEKYVYIGFGSIKHQAIIGLSVIRN